MNSNQSSTGLSSANFSSTTSVSLLASLRAKDARAWDILVALYSPLLYDWCRQAGLNTEEAGDVLQEVFSSVWTGIDSFHRDRPGDTFRGWLRAITRNKLLDYFRTRSVQPRALGGDALEFDALAFDQSAAESIQQPHESRQTFLRALELIQGEFEPQTWQVFLSTVVEGRRASEVARDLGLSAAAVRQAKCRVFRRLRQEFGEVLD